MKTTFISSTDLAKCPTHSLEAGHYRDDGTCLHTDPVPVCIESYDGTCTGETEYRPSLSPTGINHPRCSAHWAKRLVEQERINRTYPVHAPADFDPTYAGERWDEED